MKIFLILIQDLDYLTKFFNRDINYIQMGFSLTTTLTILMKLSNKKVINHEISYFPRIGKSKTIMIFDFPIRGK